MIYKAFRFEFKTPVHFGNGNLSSGEVSIHSDTLFSALCMEAVKDSQESLDELVNLFSSGKLKISDAFPFVDDTPFIPKPFCYVERSANTGSSVEKKNYKKLKYISAENFQKYFTDEYNPVQDLEMIKNLGTFNLKTSASINGLDDTVPYNIGSYTFSGTVKEDIHKAGLYIIVGYEEEEDYYLLSDYLDSLSYSGIGGKRSSGLGKFNLKNMNLPKSFVDSLGTDAKTNMLLSVSLPTDDEIEKVVEKGEYSLIKRSGFVSSYNYSDNYERKKDLYVFDSGSCFKSKFKGAIYDVSRKEKAHPVYRYAIPMWLGVNL